MGHGRGGGMVGRVMVGGPWEGGGHGRAGYGRWAMVGGPW